MAEGVADADSAGLPNRLLRKAETAIQGRTSRILAVIERCTDEHNYSAVIRTAEALGVQHIWLVDPVVRGGGDRGDEDGADDDGNGVDADDDGEGADADEGGEGGAVGSAAPAAAAAAAGGAGGGWGKRGLHGQSAREAHKLFARRANEFTTIREFRTTAECVEALREEGRTIWATDLSQRAVCLTEPALRAATAATSSSSSSVVPEKLAIVFGTESVGCTEEILAAADLRVYLPLRGFADSLNLSVAAALVMHELFHLCPEAIGAMSERERAALREKWFTQLALARAQTRSEGKRAKEVQSKLARVRKRREAASSGAVGGDASSSDDFAAVEAALMAEAAAIEAARWAAARAAVAPHLASPPAALRDMRRPDAHREAFVGPNVRARNADHWAGMAAVAHNSGLANGDNDTIRKRSKANLDVKVEAGGCG